MKNNNWLHLDFKGVVPSVEKLLERIDFFADCGFSGVILELDCRYAWKTWPGTATPLFSKNDIGKIITKFRSAGLHVIPLVQVQGHLEWILGKKPYSGLREAGHVNELCPNHPDSAELIKSWIDEAAELFPVAGFIHLGADETWNLGSCPRCKKEIAKDPEKGKIGIYTRHVSSMCRHALSKNLRPIIWADMFWREKRMDLASLLPKGTILVDWQYTGNAPFATTEQLMKSKHEVWGASAVRCSWYEHFHQAMQIPAQRIDNIVNWNRWARKNKSAVIHTTWGRPGNMWNLYPPWHEMLPVFIAAGNPARWEKHPWRKFVEKLSDVMLRCWPHEIPELIKSLDGLECRDAFEHETVRWWNLGLRYNLMEKEHHLRLTGDKCAAVTKRYVGRDMAMYGNYFVKPAAKEKKELAIWKRDLIKFWKDNELSDMDEYLKERLSIFQES